MDEKILTFLEAIDARLIEINAHLVYLCHIEEEKMKREPSTFSYIKALEVGDSTSLPSEKAYAARCAVSYMEVEYEYSYSVSTSPDGTKVTITRLF